jgi:hypothetical protein
MAASSLNTAELLAALKIPTLYALADQLLLPQTRIKHTVETVNMSVQKIKKSSGVSN